MTLIGKQIVDLDTPVLWVDLDTLERNIELFSGYLRGAGVAWRPHTKGIKTPAVAHKLLRAGAIGVTCAKLGEAEVMAAGGVNDILIANQLVGSPKLTRLAALRRHADVMVAVDDLGNAGDISRAAVAAGVKIRVLVELNVGMDRCGIEPGPGAVEFARRVADLPGLNFAGLMGWEGHLVKIEDFSEKRPKVEAAVGRLVETAELCRAAGLPVRIVSCGGTGSFRASAHVAGVTEVQAGGGIFGDVTYRRWGAGVENALFVLATVSSCATPGRAVVDAGRKSVNVEYNLPEVVGLPGVTFSKFSAEHGVLEIGPKAAPLKLGQKVNIIPGYEDLTVFLHDQLIGARGGCVETVWPILGRGKLT